MKLSDTVKPISYLKAHASEIVRSMAEDHKTYVITQNGTAKAVVQDIVSFEQTQESLRFLKMLAQSTKSLHEGRFKPIDKAFKEVSSRISNES
ncbi:MAG: type II toxin-antitoxin system Phd/YefM family antitoxin [Chitinispirillaceae bacterium]|jgi:prevent-host-death family protein